MPADIASSDRLRLPYLACVLATSCLLSATVAAAPWWVITELHYHPLDERHEFIELWLADAPGAELDGYTLTGEVEFEFPEGLRVPPRGVLLVARDPAALRKLAPEGPLIVGPWKGRLDNAGGRITLHNRFGGVAASVRYGRDGAWTRVPDGTGHTLELDHHLFEADRPESWRPSLRKGGTPGQVRGAPSRRPRAMIVEPGSEWAWHPGSSSPGAGWMAVDFDDSSWARGPGGFGYGDDDDATELADMAGAYLTVFTRKRFRVESLETLGEVELLVDFDDGFVAYLNGREVARVNAGREGSPITHESSASSDHEAGRADTIPLGDARSVLRAGENLLAVVGLNGDLGSSDFSLLVGLQSLAKPKDSSRPRDLRISELSLVRGEERLACRSLELELDTGRAVELSEYALTDDLSAPAKWPLSGRSEGDPQHLAAPTWHAVPMSHAEVPAEPGARLWLTHPASDRVLDAIAIPPRALDGLEPAEPLVLGRFPDGGSEIAQLAAPTPGAPNHLEHDVGLVLTEISYSPSSGDVRETFLEITCATDRRGDAPSVDLAGLSIVGGVSYRFDAATRLRPGESILVAQDPAHLRANDPENKLRVVGPFEGRLSKRGEEIRLVDARGRVLDRVRYADRAPWPRLADGGSSTLELIDPSLDNALPGAWRASDERESVDWQTIEFEREVRLFRGMRAQHFSLLLLDHGECLIDDFRLLDAEGKVLVSQDFDDLAGDLEAARRSPPWTAHGTHGASGVLREGTHAANPCYRILANDRGNSRENNVAFRLPEELRDGSTYRVSFRARWQAGSNLLLVRSTGQGLARVWRLDLPKRPGSPGTASVQRGPVPPVLGTPRQWPIAPRADESVTLELPISSAATIETARIEYRDAGREDSQLTEWSHVALRPLSKERTQRGSVVWRGALPPRPRGRVDFRVRVVDASGSEARFPRGSEARSASYGVGLSVDGEYPSYTVFIDEASQREGGVPSRMSNRLSRASLVVDGRRIFHDVGFRRRGSPFTRGQFNWRLMFDAETLDGRHALTFDGQGGGANSITERLTFWLCDALDVPTPRQRWVQLSIDGNPRESGRYDETERVDRAYLARWFPNAENPDRQRLHKVDDYWDLAPPSSTNERRGGLGFFGRDRGERSPYLEAFFEFDTEDAEDYRWNFPPRANGRTDDFAPLTELIRLLDPEVTEDATFDVQAESLMNVDAWVRVLAARSLSNDWDSIGINRGKNAYVYRSATDGLWYLLPWDSDLSWRSGGFGGFGRGPQNPLAVPEKFPAIRRLLGRPDQRRAFVSNLAWLAKRRLEPAGFDRVLGEYEQLGGVHTEPYREFARQRYDDIVHSLPTARLRVTSARRVPREGQSDVLRVEGTAPLHTHRLLLDGRRGQVRWTDLTAWEADFPIGSDEALLELLALRIDGRPVGTRPIAISARPGAPSLENPGKD